MKATIGTEQQLTRLLSRLEAAIADRPDTITVVITIPKSSRLKHPNEFGGEGFTEEGVRIANVLDQRILPVRGKTCYRWTRTSASTPAGIVWRFSLHRKH